MKTTIQILAISFSLTLAAAAMALAADEPVKTSGKRDTLLYVSTDPPGAKVLLDGKELGKSNDLFPVEPGSKTVVVELEGHKRKSTRVTIQANEIARITLKLEIEATIEAEKSPVSSRGDAIQLSQQGWRLWQARQFDEAAAKFREAVKLSPRNENAWNGLGWASFNSGNTSEAKKAFEKVVSINPRHPAALNGLGQLYFAQKQYDVAEKYLLKAAPQAPAAWFALTKIYLLQGKFAEAEKFAQRIEDSGQADDGARRMLKAAKEKQLPEGLRAVIEPQADEAQGATLTAPESTTRQDTKDVSSDDSAKAANFGEKYEIWVGYHRGAPGVQKNAEKAKRLLTEIVNGVYIATFRPAGGFAPRTPAEFLANVNEHSSLRSTPQRLGAGFFRTKAKDGVLVGSFLTAYPEEMRKAITENPSLELVSIEKLTPEVFVQYEASPQESLDASDKGAAGDKALAAKQQAKARARMARDRRAYSQVQLREIESLYQVANQKWQTEEGRSSIKTLVQKYRRANRTGCSLVYLGQMSGGDEKVDYLKRAIAGYGDCFYGDGVQVGAFARYLLGQAYLAKGDAGKAKILFDEIRRDYPDSIDHNGTSLVAHLP